MQRTASAVFLLLLLAGMASTAHAQSVVIQTPVPNWTQGQAFALPLVGTVSGIPTPCTWTLASGSLPAGITLLSGGLLSGTPTATESKSFTLKATVPVLSYTGTRSYTMTIHAPPTVSTSSVPAGKLGKAYSASILVSNGTSPFAFLVSAGALPPGLTLSPTAGTITGTPTVEGSFAFTVLVTDLALATASRPLVLNITGPPALAASGTTTWTVGRPGFDLEIVASRGDGSYTFSAPTGLPNGLVHTVSSDRVRITGTPSAVGTATIHVKVTDGGGATATLDTPVTINPPPRITTDSLPDATVGAVYLAPLTVADGAPPYTFRLVTASAAFVAVSTDGSVTGTPPAPGPTDLTVELTDASGTIATKDLTFQTNPAPFLGPADLPIGLPEFAYVAPLPLSGGTGPITGTVIVGSLPAGLVLTGGTISGTPEGPEHAEFTVRITDRWGATTESGFSITIGRLFPVNAKLPAGKLDPRGRDAFVLDLLRGTDLSLKLKVPVGLANLAVRLVTIDGDPVNTVPYLSLSRKGLRLKKVPIPASGRYALLLTHLGGSGPVRYSGRVGAKALKSLQRKESFGPLSGEIVVLIPAMEGSVLAITAKAAGKDVPAVELSELTAPSGAPVDTGPFLRTKKGGFRISKLVLPAGGDYRLTLRPDGSGSANGTLKLSIRVKPVKPYTYRATE